MSSALGTAPAGGSASKRTSRSRRAVSDRVMSRNARQATVMSHAVGSAGGSSRPRRERPDERLLHRVLGRREVGAATDEDAQHLRDEPAQLDVVHGQSVTVGGAVRNGRTSSHSWIGSPPAPGAADSSPASSTARS